MTRVTPSRSRAGRMKQGFSRPRRKHDDPPGVDLLRGLGSVISARLEGSLDHQPLIGVHEGNMKDFGSGPADRIFRVKGAVFRFRGTARVLFHVRALYRIKPRNA
jgi:hypothetical protein